MRLCFTAYNIYSYLILAGHDDTINKYVALQSYVSILIECCHDPPISCTVRTPKSLQSSIVEACMHVSGIKIWKTQFNLTWATFAQ